MSRVNYILCAVVVLLVAVEYTAGHGHGYHGRGYGPGRGGQHHHHHRHGHHHYNPVRISLTIFDPKGMEVYVRRPNDSVQYFALEMNINEQNGGSPDVVLNTTEVVYGKYIMQDTEVVIKPGDFLNVTWSMGLAEGNAISGNQMLRVYQSMIKSNCTCEADTLPGTTRVTTTPASISSIPPWSRPTTTGVPQRATPPTTTTDTQTSSFNTLEFEGTDFGEPDSYDSMDQFDCEIDPSTNLCRASLFDERFGGQPQKLIAKPNRVDEVRALKGIIDSLLNQPCRSQPRSNMLTLANPQYSVDSSIDWLKYVRRSLGEELKLKSLALSAIRSARPRGDVIVFEMETQQDKLMMLYLCKEIGMSTVKDYD